MKTILVTGAAGFIGFHAAKALKQRGDRVIGLDNFNAYYTPQLKRDRAAILETLDIEVIECDLNDRVHLLNLFETHQITHILHLAAQAGVRYAQKFPDAYIHSNIDGFLSILEICRLYPHCPLVYASSSSVYGLNEKIPFCEKDLTDSPANLYASTKKANELMAYSYHHLFNIPCTGLRFFTVYGPWGRPDMAYYSFTNAIIKQQPIRLFNQGKMQRDFTYIDDAVKGILSAIDLNAPWEIFNIGNNRPEEILHFVALLEEKLGRKTEKIFEKDGPGEVEKTFADVSHSHKILGFLPTINLSEGLDHFLTWYKDYHFV
jgi:UDP-glucuronate 4-epimerase